MQLEQLPGVRVKQLAGLRASGIRSCRQLLRASQRRERLVQLAQTTDLPLQVLQQLVQRAELSQIRGIGPTMLGHLCEVGVDSLEALAGQEPETLQSQLQKVVARPPNLAVIENWILQSRQRKSRQATALLQRPG